MSIKVGQIRKTDGASYLNALTPMIGTKTTSQLFTDSVIKINGGNFVAGTTYYVRLNIKRIDIKKPMGSGGSGTDDPHTQLIEVKLYDSDNSSNYQLIGNLIEIEPYSNSNSQEASNEDEFIQWCNACVDDGDPNIDDESYSGARNYLNALKEEENLTDEDKFILWCKECIINNNPSMDNYEGAQDYFKVLEEDYNSKKSTDKQGASSPIKVIELVFTPYVNSTTLALELKRVSYDYNHQNARTVEIEEASGNIDLASIVNVLPSNNQIINKIGIQSDPSSLVIINGEGMRIGKSGILELNSGINILSVGFAAPNAEIKDFILDYIYEENN